MSKNLKKSTSIKRFERFKTRYLIYQNMHTCIRMHTAVHVRKDQKPDGLSHRWLRDAHATTVTPRGTRNDPLFKKREQLHFCVSYDILY